MYRTHSTAEKISLLLKIMVPILISQLAVYAMNFFDTVMSGHASASDLAGVAIGSSFWMPVFSCLSGIIQGLTPVIAQYMGSKNEDKTVPRVWQTVYLALILFIVIIAAGSLLTWPILSRMSLTGEVRTVAFEYLAALSFGILPLLLYTVLRSFIDALGFTRITMLITLTGVPINAFINYLLIFGHWGFPEMGGVGAGVATSITAWFLFFLSLITLLKTDSLKKFRLFHQIAKPRFAEIYDQLKIGGPIGFSIFFETSIFAAVALFMSAYDTVTVASHQAAINFASFLYMVPLSISIGLTIAVGYEAGAGRHREARTYAVIGIFSALIFAFLFAAGLWLFRYPVAGLYSNSQAVIQMTAHFLVYAMFFQLADAFGAPVQGSLRGYKDVNVTFLLSLLSYWIIGLPAGMMIARWTALGPYGYWLGLIIGLAAGAVCLFSRLFTLNRRKEREQKTSENLQAKGS